MLWRSSALALLLTVGGVAPVVGARPACADAPHHAALVIDTGDRVVRRCVGFSEDTISGQQVLDRANVDVQYSNKYSEAFVCSILGVGNDQAHCPNSDPNQNWVYWEASSGSAVYTRPNQGASRTKVHDGDVEAWHWTTGVPPFVSEADVCATAAPATSASTASSPAAPQPPPSPPAVRSVTGATVAGTSTSSTVAAAVSEATKSTTTTAAPKPDLALPAAADKGGSPLGVVAVGILIAGIGTATWRINKRRSS